LVPLDELTSLGKALVLLVLSTAFPMSSATKRTGRSSLRNLISGRKTKDKSDGGSVVSSDEQSSVSSSKNGSSNKPYPREAKSEPGINIVPPSSAQSRETTGKVNETVRSKELSPRSANQGNDEDENAASTDTASTRGRTGNVLQRLRERSRSRSRSRNAARQPPENAKEMLVAVTSCRSDGYFNQKAPGSTSKLPRKAPTNLKLFHELAVGVKDAYAAVGATPRNPTEEENKTLGKEDLDAKVVLWDFIGNLDFVRSE
jgi:hypothetical protein